MIKHARLPVVAVIVLGAWAVTAGQVSLQEKRGKQIYLRGTSPSGAEMTAALAEGSVEVPASTLSCVGCHGFDGRGNSEGGVTPSNISWEALTTPYGVTHPDGRKHPPYTGRSLALAVSAGLDPAGNKLASPMPLYRLSREDMADLIAYMKRLGKDPDPGLGDTSITLGTALPSSGPLAGAGQAVRAVLEACVAEINGQGGVYNRKLELRVADCGDDSTGTASHIEQFLRKEQVFAMLGAFVAGADKQAATIMEHEETPLIGPLSLFPRNGFPLNRYVFYLQPGMRDQARALVTFAKTKLGLDSPRVTVVYAAGEVTEDAAEGIDRQSKGVGWGEVARIKLAPETAASKVVTELRRNRTEVLILLCPAPAAISLLKEADNANWTPRVLIPGTAASREMLDQLSELKARIYFSFPVAPEDTPATIDFRALAAKYKLPPRHVPAQISAYCAARVLIEALQRAGRDLSREKLVTTLEGLYDFDTGLMPPLSFGPNRRIGAQGAYVVTLDPEKKKLALASGWIPVSGQ